MRYIDTLLRTRTIILLVCMFTVQVSLAAILFSEFGLGRTWIECSLAHIAMLGPAAPVTLGPLVAKVGAVVLECVLLLAIGGILITHASFRAAIVGTALFVATPEPLRRPFLVLGGPAAPSSLWAVLVLFAYLEWRRTNGRRNAVLLGALAGAGVAFSTDLLPVLLGLGLAYFLSPLVRHRRSIVAALVIISCLFLLAGERAQGQDTPLGIAGHVPSILAIILVLSGTFIPLISPTTGQGSELNTAAGGAGLILIATSLLSSSVTGTLALAWIILIIAAAPSLTRPPGSFLIGCVVVVCLIDGLYLTDIAEQKDLHSHLWEQCVRTIARAAAREGIVPRIEGLLSKDAGYHLALAYGEGLAAGVIDAKELVQRCAVLGSTSAEVCIKGLGSGTALRVWEERSMTVTPCGPLNGALRTHCLEGVGAGLFLETRRQGTSLEEGMALCALLLPPDVPVCLRGFGRSLGHSRPTRPGEIQWDRCAPISDRYIYHCYWGPAGTFGWEIEPTVEAAIATCIEPHPDNPLETKVCLTRFAGAMGLHHQGDTARAVSLCEELPPHTISYCLEGVSDYLGWYLVDEPSLGPGECDHFPLENRGVCYQMLGNALGWFHVDHPELAVAACTSLVAKARSHCYQGLGEAFGWETAPDVAASIARCGTLPVDGRPYCNFGLGESYGCKYNSQLERSATLCAAQEFEGLLHSSEGFGYSQGWQFGHDPVAAMERCDVLAEGAPRELCRLSVGDRILWQHGHSRIDAIALCRTFPEDLMLTCLRGLGRYDGWMFGAGLTEPRDICAEEPAAGRPFCAEMFGRTLALRNGFDMAAAACDGQDEQTPHCWRGIGWALGWIEGASVSADACSLAGGHREQCLDGLCSGRTAVKGVVLDGGLDMIECAVGSGAGLWWRYNGDGIRTAEDCSSFPPDEAGACSQGAGLAAVRESLYMTGISTDVEYMCETMGTLMDACLMGVAEGVLTE